MLDARFHAGDRFEEARERLVFGQPGERWKADVRTSEVEAAEVASGAAWVRGPLPVRFASDARAVVETFIARSDLPRGEAADRFTFVLAFQEEGRPDLYLLPAGAAYDPSADAAKSGSTAAWQDVGVLGEARVLACGIAVAVTGVAAWLAKRKDVHLPALPLVFLFTRLRRSELLDQHTRRQVYEAIRAEPGIRYGELRATTGLPTGVLHHHLRVLGDHDLIVDVRRGRQRHLYPTGIRAIDASPRGSLSDPQARILALLETEALAQRDLAARLGITQQGVNYHLRRLWARGLLVRERGSAGAWLYAAAPGTAPARPSPPDGSHSRA
jgi:DNA-binding transcriptional ArsR family regulator